MVTIVWAIVLIAVVIVVVVGIFARLVGFGKVIIFEYQRGLKYVRGCYRETLPPGRHWTIGSTRIIPVDIRQVFITIPGQELLTADGVTVKISIAAQYEVQDANIAINKNAAYQTSLYLLLQMGLRSLVSGEKIDVLIENRANIAKRLMDAAAPEAAAIGVRLISADIKDLMLPGDVRKVFSQVVKAQKEGMAALERARGESAALRNLANAAKMIEDNPNLLQLRALQVLGESGGNTLFFGVPSGAVVQPGKSGNGNKPTNE